MNTRKKNNILIVTLVVAMLFMSVAYAILSQQLNLSGSASTGDAKWSVEITDITVKAISGAAKSNSESFTVTSATFDTELSLPNDSITYEVTVQNLGTVDAALKSITSNIAELHDEQAYLRYVIEGANEETVLAAGDTTTVSITVSFEDVDELPPEPINQTLTATLNYVQN